MILVTGGTGLVGSHVIYELLQSGRQVRVLARPGSKRSNLQRVFSYYSAEADELFKRLEWAEGDILDVYSLEQAMQGVQEVYHCAAMISFHPGEEAGMMQVNVEGTANVVNACISASVKKLCHVSSVAALPESDQGSVVQEDTFWKSMPGSSNYALSKYAAEREAWRGMEEGLDTVVVNPSIVIGPGEWTKSSSNMISASYKGIRFYTEGVCGFVDVRDVARSMVQLMQSDAKNERFIINAENLSFRSFFGMTHRCLGKPEPFIPVGKTLSRIGWRLEKLRKGLQGKKSYITRETAMASQKKNFYSNNKIRERLAYGFIPIERSIQDTCTLFLKDHG